MEQSLYRFILRYSARQQVILTLLALASFVPYYFYLDMPKTIVNQGISGRGVSYPVDLWGLGVVELDQTGYLLVLCFAFLGLVIVQQGFKYAINVYQGISGERMLRRLRYQLYSHVLRFPLPTFRKMSQGEIIPMITAEVEPLGGFVAESFSLPIFQGGMLLVIFTFLMYQNWLMGLAAVSLYPIQFYLVPKLQRRVNALGKERVRTVRKLADRIGESIAGVQEIHANDGSQRLLADITKRLGTIYWIRFEIFQRKFVIKFINNFIQQLGPFFFYSIGGYLAIRGELDVGTIVAAVSAHKEMGAPWKELLTHYQAREDARIKYEQVISQFVPAGMRAPEDQATEPAAPPSLLGPLDVRALTYVDEHGGVVLDNVSFQAPLPGSVAIVGGAGRDELMLILARLLDASRGKVMFNGVDLAEQPETVTGRRLALVPANAFLFNTSVAENLLFAVRHRPLSARTYDGDARRRFDRELHEARESGNLEADFDADWTDYAAAGAGDAEALKAFQIRALRLARLEDDVYQYGLRGTVDPDGAPALAERILTAREGLRRKLDEGDARGLVETWDRAKYNFNATVGENMLFGTTVGDALHPDRLATNPYVLSVLEKVGLRERFLEIGLDVARTMVELFADLPADHELFQQYSFISADDLSMFKDLVARVAVGRLQDMAEGDRQTLMSLPFKLIPARHRLGEIDKLAGQLLEARAAFSDGLPEELRGAVAFFDPQHYTRGANLLDNIVFGKIAYGQAQAADRVGQLIAQVIDELDLRDTVIEVGLGFEVGIGGARLAAAQRQKLALARAILKRPDVLLLSEATAPFDPATERAVWDALFDEFRGRAIVASLQRATLAERFDCIVVLHEGRAVECGSFAELNRDGTEFRRLLQSA